MRAALLIGDRWAVPSGATISRKPARSNAQIIDGAIVVDTPGYYTVRPVTCVNCNKGSGEDLEAVCFDPRAVPMVAHAGGATPLLAYTRDPRTTQARCERSIEQPMPPYDARDGREDGAWRIPSHGQPGAILPWDGW